MSRSRTPQQLRRLALELTDEHAAHHAEATYESGRTWHLDWVDGPTLERVRVLVGQAAPEAEVRMHRQYSPRAWVMAGLRADLAGDVDRFGASGSQASWAAEHLLRESEAPDRPAPGEERLAAMAERLLERTEGDAAYYEERLLEPLATDGAASLLTPRQGKVDAADVLIMTPAEHLTAHYATGEDAWAWKHRLRTLPTSVLVEKAMADQNLDQAGRLAVLGLLEEMRRLWSATEGAAIEAARQAGASWSKVGAALGGISKQGAADRARRRANGDRVSL